MRALVAGHLCIDFFPTLDRQPGLEEGALYAIGPMQARCGGSVYTTGVTLARLGVEVQLAAAVGNDLLAGLLTQLLRAEELDTTQFAVANTSTSYSIVTQAPGRDRTFWHHVGANEAFDGSGLDLAGVDVLHVGYPSLLRRMCEDDGQRLVDLFRRARALGCTTSLDLAVVDTGDPGRVRRWSRFLERVLPVTDIVTPSVDDLSSALEWVPADPLDVQREQAERLLAWGCAVVLLTAGASGLLVATADAGRLSSTGRLAPLLQSHACMRHLEEAVPVEHVDGTTGAGDVATAGFLAGLMQGEGPVAAARLAALAAARHVAGVPPCAQGDDATPAAPRATAVRQERTTGHHGGIS